MPLKLFPSLDGLRQHHTHRFCALWRIERTDGQIILLTDHDCPITFNYIAAQQLSQSPGATTNVAGTDEVYSPTDTIAASAKQKQAGLSDNNTDFTGAILSSSAITEHDLFAGRYREAKVVEMLVDWKYPYAGYFSRNIYYIVGLTYAREYWKAQISSSPIWLRRENGNVYNSICRWKHGDPSTCKVNLASFTASGIVTAIVTQREVFTASGLVLTNDIYDYGEVTWATGFNQGLAFDVKNSTGGQLTLQLATPFDITVGDTFTVYQGCDHGRGTCISKFSNIANFGGYPTIPGNDVMVRGPLS